MYYFKTLDNIITTRPFQFNAEVINGELITIQPKEKAAVVIKRPLVEGWEFSFHSLGTAEECFTRAQELGPFKGARRPHFVPVLLEELEQLGLEQIAEKKQQVETAVKTTPIVKPVTPRPAEAYRMRLTRTNEPNILRR